MTAPKELDLPADSAHSLTIGLLFLGRVDFIGDFAETMLRETRFAGIARESLLIGGWVAMWRPLECLFDRLSAMVVRVVPSRSG